MNYRLQFRRYRLPFRSPVRTAHRLWTEREGVVVRMETEAGGVGYGEAAPIPWFGTETVDEVEAACRELGDSPDDEALEEVPARSGCLRNALAAGRREVGPVCDRPSKQKKASSGGQVDERGAIRDADLSDENGPVADRPYLGVAALLPAGRAALEQVATKAEAGFRVFKWKVGVGDIADELGLLDELCAALPRGAKLRLDANGAWDRRKAERWLERCAERPVEFVEQPCFAEPTQGAALQRKMDDLLIGLAGDWPTPIALDESIAVAGDIERWIAVGWPGVLVVKPALLGDVAGTLARLGEAKADVVFSSALETAVGAQAALRAAFAWGRSTDSGQAGEPRALGFGVWPLFADARFDGPAAAPFIRAEDVEKLNPEAIWNALS